MARFTKDEMEMLINLTKGTNINPHKLGQAYKDKQIDHDQKGVGNPGLRNRYRRPQKSYLRQPSSTTLFYKKEGRRDADAGIHDDHDDFKKKQHSRIYRTTFYQTHGENDAKKHGQMNAHYKHMHPYKKGYEKEIQSSVSRAKFKNTETSLTPHQRDQLEKQKQQRVRAAETKRKVEADREAH